MNLVMNLQIIEKVIATCDICANLIWERWQFTDCIGIIFGLSEKVGYQFPEVATHCDIEQLTRTTLPSPFPALSVPFDFFPRTTISRL